MRKAYVVWSDEALRDLETIYDFLAENSPHAAQRIVESILGRTKQLESFPESGPKQQSVTSGTIDYRYLIEGNFKILYRYQPEDQTVYVAVIIDSRTHPEGRMP